MDAVQDWNHSIVEFTHMTNVGAWLTDRQGLLMEFQYSYSTDLILDGYHP